MRAPTTGRASADAMACPHGGDDTHPVLLESIEANSSQPERRMNAEKPDRQIAAGLGVSNSTVSVARKDMVNTGELCESHSSVGADGKERPLRNTKTYPLI